MALKEIKSVEDAVDGIKNVLDGLQEGDRFMVAIWKVEGAAIRLERTTYTWPTKECGRAVEMLSNDLQQNEAYDEPLPEAAFPFPLGG